MDKNHNYKQRINNYLISINRNLIGIPDNQKRQYLDELGKGLEQEYIDSFKLNSNQNEFFSTLDDPKQVAKEFLQSMNFKPHLWAKLTVLFASFELFVESSYKLGAIVAVFLFSVIPFLISIVTANTEITFRKYSISVTGYYPNQISVEGYNLFSYLAPFVTLFLTIAFSIRILVFLNIKKSIIFAFIQEVVFYLTYFLFSICLYIFDFISYKDVSPPKLAFDVYFLSFFESLPAFITIILLTPILLIVADKFVSKKGELWLYQVS